MALNTDSVSQFSSLLLASFVPSTQKEAEAQIHAARTRDTDLFALHCKSLLTSSNQPATARHLAAILLRNLINRCAPGQQNSNVRKPRGWPESVAVSTQSEIRSAVTSLLLAGEEECLRNALSPLLARIASVDLLEKGWDEFVPALRTMISSGSKTAPSAYVVIGCLAEEWWSGFVPESSSDHVACLCQNLLEMCLDGITRSMELCTRTAAAEALHSVLGIVRTALLDHSVMVVVVEALLSTCAANASTDVKLSLACLRCHVRSATDSYSSLSSIVDRIIPTMIHSLSSTDDEVVVQALEFWTSLAMQEALVPVCDGQIVKRHVSVLMPIFVRNLQAAQEFDEIEGENRADAVRACLSWVSLCAPRECAEAVRPDLGVALHNESIATVSAACSLCGSLAEALSDEISSLLAVAAPLLIAAISKPKLDQVALWAIGRLLEFHPRAFPLDKHAAVFELCLQQVCKASSTSEICSYVLEGLAGAAPSLPMANCLLQEAMSDSLPSSLSREALLNCLALTVDVLPSNSNACFRAILLALLQWVEAVGTRQPEGLSTCLQVLTRRLGDDLADVAERMMALYLEVLRVGYTRDGALHCETLLALGELVNLLGLRFSSFAAATWPALAFGMAEHSCPSVCSACFGIFNSMCKNLGSQILPFASNAKGIIVQLLRGTDLMPEFKPTVVTSLAYLADAVGPGLPGIVDCIDLLNDMGNMLVLAWTPPLNADGKDGKGVAKGAAGTNGRGARKGKGKGKGGVQRVLDEWIYRRKLMDAVLLAYKSTLAAYQRSSGSLTSIQGLLPPMLKVITHQVLRPRASSTVLSTSAQILFLIQKDAHDDLVAYCSSNAPGSLEKLADFMTSSENKSTDVDTQLFKQAFGPR